jgi:hypothetical protein
MDKELQVIFSAGRLMYAVPDVRRECGLWLSVEKHPLPVGPEWHRPDSIAACVMRGRDYYRVGMFRPSHTNGSEARPPDDELVRDYRDAAWWTPGLEEAWAESDGYKLALAEAQRAPEKGDEILVGAALEPPAGWHRTEGHSDGSKEKRRR